MDAYEFAPLPEEFASPAAEYPSPPEEFPERRPTAAPRAKSGLLKKLMLLSSALVAGGMLFGVGTPAAQPAPGGQEPVPVAVVEAPEPVPNFTDPEISINYAVLEEGPEGRTLTYTYLIMTQDAHSVDAFVRAEDGSGHSVAFRDGEADNWGEHSRGLRPYTLDVSQLSGPVTLVVEGRYQRLGQDETMVVSRQAMPKPPAPATGARFTLSGQGAEATVDYMAYFAPDPDDPFAYELEVEGLSLRWYREGEDGSFLWVGSGNVDALLEAVPGSEGWLFPYQGPAFLTPPEGATHFAYVLDLMDWNLLLPFEIETELQTLPQPVEEPYYPTERLVYPLEGDRVIWISVMSDVDMQFHYGFDGSFIGTSSTILLETEIPEKDFTGMELPMPEMQEGFRFLGYVMHSKGGSDEEGYFEYNEFVGIDLSPEEASHAPLIHWTNPDTGVSGTSRYIELHDMWLYNGDPAEDPYLLTLDANGGEFVAEGVTTHENETYSVRSPLYSSTMCWTAAFPEPVRRGYRFTGWYWTPEADGEPVDIVMGDEFYPILETEGDTVDPFGMGEEWEIPVEDLPEGYVDRDWSTVIPLTLYAGWERVQPGAN